MSDKLCPRCRRPITWDVCNHCPDIDPSEMRALLERDEARAQAVYHLAELRRVVAENVNLAAERNEAVADLIAAENEILTCRAFRMILVLPRARGVQSAATMSRSCGLACFAAGSVGSEQSWICH